MRPRALASVLLAALLASSPAALGQGAPPVLVVLPPCPSFAFDPRALLELLRVELGPGEAGSDLVVTVEPRRCEETLVRLRIDDRASGRHSEEEVELADTPEADRARLLALSIAELLRAPFDPEPAAPPPREPEEAAPASPTPAVDREALLEEAREVARLEARAALAAERAAAPAPHRTLWLGAALGLRLAPEVGGTLAQLGLLALIEPAAPSWLQVGLELGLGAGGGLDELGRVVTLSPGAALRLAWVGRSSRALAASVGLRGAFGWAWAAGRGSRAGVVEGRLDGAVVDLDLFALLLVRLSERLRLVVDLRLGYGLVPFVPDAAGRPVGGLSGAGVVLGIGLVGGLGPASLTVERRASEER